MDSGHQTELFSYLAVIVFHGESYWAFFPDVHGCISAANTQEAIRAELLEALTWHLESMLEDHDAIPPATTSQYQGPTSESDGSVVVDQYMVTCTCTLPALRVA